jgi:very-short-patch-repair endonuclease
MTKKTTATDLFTCLCRSELGVRCVKEYRFHPVRKWRFDYAIPEHLVALEVEGGVWIGGRHTSPKGFLGDMEKYNTATTMGWKVLRTTPDDLCTNKTLEMLKSAIFGLNTGESVKAGRKKNQTLKLSRKPKRI